MYEGNEQIIKDDFHQEALKESDGVAGGSRIVEFYRNRSVFITGGSGFIGKVLIEKLLRTCPDLKRIYVLVRPKFNKKPKERLEEILNGRLFDKIRETLSDGNLESRVVCVEGDVMETNLGLSEQNLLRIMNEVSVVYHSAATVKFDEPLKQAIPINITGTKNIIEVCRKIPKLASLVHVSTAYANCDLKEVDEHIYPVQIEPEKLIELASWMDQEMLQQLKKQLLCSKPNTYTYTKAIAEWLLVKCASDLPMVICRPSIVCASWKEPIPGWIDNVNGPTGVILGAGKGLVRSMYVDSSCVADLIPVDVVINQIITLGWFANVYNKQNLDQLSSSRSSASEANFYSESSADESFERVNLRGPISHNRAPVTCSSDSEVENNNNNNNDNQNNDLYPIKRDNHLKFRQQPVTVDDGYTSQTSSLDQSQSGDTSKSTSPTPDEQQLVKDHNNRVLSLMRERKIVQQEDQAEFDYKIKQFRQKLQNKLTEKKLPRHLADIPVFHCTSGDKKPIKWGQISVLILTMCCIYPSSTTYRYPRGAFTINYYMDYFYRMTLHYLPAYLLDFITKLTGGKPILVKIFKKFDQATNVLKAFTTKQWKFNTDNETTLLKEFMSEEDKRLFNFDVSNLTWESYLKDYVLGVREFLLKEPISNLEQARRNLSMTYYRNLGLQILSGLALLYFIQPYGLSLIRELHVSSV